MEFKSFFLFSLILILIHCSKINCDDSMPSVLIVTLIRNKAHTLPYFFSYLENQDYAKNKISLWMKSDHNEDDSIKITKAWIDSVKDLYQKIDFQYESVPTRRNSERNSFHWTEERYVDVIKMKEEGLEFGRENAFDYVLFLDADIFLTNPSTITRLIQLKLPIVAPLMKTESLYANFWGGMRENHFYLRTDEYMTIKKYEKTGEFKVPLVNSIILIDMKNPKTKYLTHDIHKLISHDINGSSKYNGPLDDMIIFAKSAQYAEIDTYISNSENYGYMMAPVENVTSLKSDKKQLINVLVLIINENGNVFLIDTMKEHVPKMRKTKMGLSKIFVINLEHDRERLLKLTKQADIIGLEIERFDAIDGKSLTKDDFFNQRITLMPNVVPMQSSEIGRFISHYRIWEYTVFNRLNETLVLEDGIIFHHYFQQMTLAALSEARIVVQDFDLLYLGRNAFGDDGDNLEGSKLLRHPGTSMSLVGYVITWEGARKLINSMCLEKLVPLEDFIQIMCDMEVKGDMRKHFAERNLKVYGMDPPILSERDNCDRNCQKSEGNCDQDCAKSEENCDKSCAKSEENCDQACAKSEENCDQDCAKFDENCDRNCQKSEENCGQDCAKSEENCDRGCAKSEGNCDQDCAKSEENCDQGCAKSKENCDRNCKKFDKKSENRNSENETKKDEL
uniref:CSON006145 protein n=1 Tax=Culicoides sonorensis TaxID=179676 RepID=A0A336M109_CULSO